MTRRMLDTSIWANEHFADLPPMGRLLLIGIITLADDQGRCKANPAYLRSQIFPYDNLATEDIDAWLQQLRANETIILYTANGKAYLQMINWWSYQPLDWARPSDHPAPDGWQDRIRYNAKGGVHLTYNWTTKAGAPMPDTCDSRGNPLGTRTQEAIPTPTKQAGKVRAEVGTQVATQVGTTSTNADKLDQTKLDQTKQAVAAPAAALDSDTAIVFQAWTENMPGVLTPKLVDSIHDLLAEYNAHELVRAIGIACERERRTLGYVRGILQKGIDRSPSSQKGTRNGTRKPGGTRMDGPDEPPPLDPTIIQRFAEHRARLAAKAS